jgi:hypothetical protein
VFTLFFAPAVGCLLMMSIIQASQGAEVCSGSVNFVTWKVLSHSCTEQCLFGSP